MLGSFADEAFGMTLVSGIENGLPFRDQLGRLAVMHSGGRKQVQSGMVVLMVIPGKEVLAKAAGILDRAETVRVSRTIFHGFEVRFRKWVVVGDVRTAMSPDDAQVGEQQGQGLHSRMKSAGK